MVIEKREHYKVHNRGLTVANKENFMSIEIDTQLILIILMIFFSFDLTHISAITRFGDDASIEMQISLSTRNF